MATLATSTQLVLGAENLIMSQNQPAFVESIKPINIADELQSSYLDYAMSVITSRALPDARDGFKPVHRRVIYSMYEDGHTPEKATVKSAAIVGKVMGEYHPHGDLAIYDTLVRMAQDFSLRYPLVHGQGNFGGRGEESAAAMRYTEAKMTKMALELVSDIDKQTVNFQPNYSNTRQEPLVLPTRIPNLLVNGSQGIAVGMATSIPPHNLSEVIDGCLAYIEQPDISIDQLMRFIPAPDFPTGGVILAGSGIREAYHTGRGSCLLRSVYSVTEERGIKKVNITEIPYQISYNKIIEKITDLIKSGEIEGIVEVLNLSKNNINIELRIHKDFDPHVVMNQLFAKSPLQVRVSFNMLALHKGRPQTLNLKDFISIFIDFRREVITRRCVYELNAARRSAHIFEAQTVALANIEDVIALIRSCPSRADAKKGLMDRSWDGAVLSAMLQASGEDPAIARIEFLDPRFGLQSNGQYYFTEEQADAILDMSLSRLTGLEQSVINGKYQELLNKIIYLLGVLNSPAELTRVLKEELIEVKERHRTRQNNQDARLSEISYDALENDENALVNKEDIVITLSRDNYIKYQPLNEYRSQRRGGAGKQATKLKDEDVIDQLVVATTTDTLLCFTTLGRVFQIKAYRLPKANRNARGRPMSNFMELAPGEKITNIINLEADLKSMELDDKFLFFATERGFVKRTKLSAFANLRKNGLKAIKLRQFPVTEFAGVDEDDENLVDGVELDDNEATNPDASASQPVANQSSQPTAEPESANSNEDDDDNDEVLGEAAEGYVSDRLAHVGICSASDNVFLFSRNGKAICFPVAKVRDQGRASTGVRGMRLIGEDNAVISMLIAPAEKALNSIFLCTEAGFGKRVEASQFPIRANRGSQGVNCIKFSPRVGSQVVAACELADEDQIVVISSAGTLIRTNADQVRLMGRAAGGVRVFNLRNGETVATVERIIDGKRIEQEDLEAERAMAEFEAQVRGETVEGAEEAPATAEAAQEAAEAATAAPVAAAAAPAQTAPAEAAETAQEPAEASQAQGEADKAA